MSCSNWIEVQAIVLEKEKCIIPAIYEIDTFNCTNGLKTVISAEGSVEESCGCTTSEKDSRKNDFVWFTLIPPNHLPVFLQQLFQSGVHDVIRTCMNNQNSIIVCHTGCLVTGCWYVFQTTTRHDHLFPGESCSTWFVKLFFKNRVADEPRLMVLFFIFRQDLKTVISLLGT